MQINLISPYQMIFNKPIHNVLFGVFVIELLLRYPTTFFIAALSGVFASWMTIRGFATGLGVFGEGITALSALCGNSNLGAIFGGFLDGLINPPAGRDYPEKARKRGRGCRPRSNESSEKHAFECTCSVCTSQRASFRRSPPTSQSFKKSPLPEGTPCFCDAVDCVKCALRAAFTPPTAYTSYQSATGCNCGTCSGCAAARARASQPSGHSNPSSAQAFRPDNDGIYSIPSTVSQTATPVTVVPGPYPYTPTTFKNGNINISATSTQNSAASARNNTSTRMCHATAERCPFPSTCQVPGHQGSASSSTNAPSANVPSSNAVASSNAEVCPCGCGATKAEVQEAQGFIEFLKAALSDDVAYVSVTPPENIESMSREEISAYLNEKLGINQPAPSDTKPTFFPFAANANCAGVPPVSAPTPSNPTPTERARAGEALSAMGVLSEAEVFAHLDKCFGINRNGNVPAEQNTQTSAEGNVYSIPPNDVADLERKYPFPGVKQTTRAPVPDGTVDDYSSGDEAASASAEYPTAGVGSDSPTMH